jgi:hypothetical protein
MCTACCTVAGRTWHTVQFSGAATPTSCVALGTTGTTLRSWTAEAGRAGTCCAAEAACRACNAMHAARPESGACLDAARRVLCVVRRMPQCCVVSAPRGRQRSWLNRRSGQGQGYPCSRGTSGGRSCVVLGWSVLIFKHASPQKEFNGPRLNHDASTSSTIVGHWQTSSLSSLEACAGELHAACCR